MKIFKHLKPYTLLMLVIVGLTYLQVLANLQLPDYMAKIVNDGIMQKNNGIIYQNGWLMLAVAFGGAACAVLGGLLASWVSTGFARDIRHKVFAQAESFSINEFNKFSTASLLTRSTNDIQQIQTVLILLLRMMLMAPFMAIGALQKALVDAPNLSWIIGLAVAVLFVLIAVLFVTVLPRFTRIQQLVDKLNLVARENLTGLRVVRAFNKEAYEEQKFAAVNQDLTGLNLFVNRMMMLMQPIMTLVLNGALLAIIWFGAVLIDAGTLDIGRMLAFMQYAMQVIMSFLMISVIFIMVPRAMVSAKRVSEVLDTEPSIKDPVKPKHIADVKGEIEFRDVSFIYPGASEPALSRINFTAALGTITAIVGGTGSGKTTLVNLIPRLQEATSGDVFIDGVNVRELAINELHKYIGFVPQKATLFSGTIKSNVTYGNHKASAKLIKTVMDTAQASEFVNRLPGKLESPIAQGGANVSGGQKQRLAIARALAIEPKVYVFDDSFSALDLKTDSALRRALKPLAHERTLIIVAQRISTIMNADNIIVLDEGRCVAQGTHAELMKKSSVYKEIAYSQLSKDELAAIAAAQQEAE